MQLLFVQGARGSKRQSPLKFTEPAVRYPYLLAREYAWRRPQTEAFFIQTQWWHCRGPVAQPLLSWMGAQYPPWPACSPWATESGHEEQKVPKRAQVHTHLREITVGLEPRAGHPENLPSLLSCSVVQGGNNSGFQEWSNGSGSFLQVRLKCS